MGKLIFVTVMLTMPLAGATAFAQDDSRGGYVASELNKPAPGQLLNEDYLTGTGETVPRPGASQSGGTTPLDRAIQQQDNKIDNSICNGC